MVLRLLLGEGEGGFGDRRVECWGGCCGDRRDVVTA